MRGILPGLIAAAVLTAGLTGCRRTGVPTQPSPDGTVRVISLAPSLTEMICALGAADCLVGRTSACDYPPDAVARVPVVGGFGDPSMERILTARPTVIVDVALADEAQADTFASLGLRQERIRCASLDDIPTAFERLGALLNRKPEAEAAAAQFRRQVATLRATASTTAVPVRVFAEIWHDPVMTVGRPSFLSEVIRLAGGTNVGDAVDRDYFQVAPEWLLTHDPEVILCFYMTTSAQVQGEFRQRPGWDQMAAVRNGRVYAGFDNNTILRPGPRVIEGVTAIRRCLQGGTP